MSHGIDQLICVSLSVKSGDAAQVRERATLKNESEVRAILEKAALSPAEASLFYVSTCHRVEMYGFACDPQKILEFWLKARGVSWESQRLKSGLEAFRHLVRVTSSLESEVLGETQITGQVKEAAEKARQSGLLKGPLDRSVQHALRAAKKIRHSTLLSEGVVSVAHVAVDGLQDVFESFEGKTALVIGAGAMALQALERMLQLGIENLTWVNRSRERIEKHPHSQKVLIQDYRERHELAWQHSIVVVATASPDLVLSLSELRQAEERKQRFRPDPRIILDLGLPRNVDEKVHGYRGFFLRNVDEFKDRAEENSSKRRSEIERAEKILTGEVESFVKIWNTWGKGPFIAEIFKGVERLRELELDEVSVEKNAEIEYIVRSIYAKLMHRLVEELDGLDEPLATQVMETMVRAWRHPEQWLQRSQQASERRQKQNRK